MLRARVASLAHNAMLVHLLVYTSVSTLPSLPHPLPGALQALSHLRQVLKGEMINSTSGRERGGRPSLWKWLLEGVMREEQKRNHSRLRSNMNKGLAG